MLEFIICYAIWTCILTSGYLTLLAINETTKLLKEEN